MSAQDDHSRIPARTVVRVYIFSVAGTLAWLGLIFLAPWLRSRASGPVSGILYPIFATVCHQIPDRCFVLWGSPLPVCGRCLGIYAGFLLGLAVYPFLRGFSRLDVPRPRLFLALCLPMGLDFAAGLFRIWSSPIWVRFGTGALWGVLLPFYSMAGLAELARVVRGRSLKTAEGLLETRDGKNIK